MSVPINEVKINRSRLDHKVRQHINRLNKKKNNPKNTNKLCEDTEVHCKSFIGSLTRPVCPVKIRVVLPKSSDLQKHQGDIAHYKRYF